MKAPPAGFGGPIAPFDAPRIRGLCHWGGEPAGHLLGADSPSRRAAEHASAKRTKPPCPHWLRGLSQTHHVNAVSRHRRAPPFASSRRTLTHALLAHLQWQEPPTQVYRRKRNQPGINLRAIALARSDHPTATGESAPSVTLPRRCRMSSCGAETHLLFTGHSAIDASDTSTRRAWSER